MSAVVRQVIADAASTVEGVEIHPYFRQTTKVGTGMVRMDRQTRASNGFGFVTTWQLLVILPQDIAAAEKYLEEKLPALMEAVGEQMVIQTVAPQELVLENGRLPCVVIEGARETS